MKLRRSLRCHLNDGTVISAWPSSLIAGHVSGPWHAPPAPSIATPLWFPKWILLIISTRIDYMEEYSLHYK